MLEKAAAIKKFQYSTLTKEFKNPTSTAVKLYQKQDKVFESNENEGEEIKKVVLSQIEGERVKIVLLSQIYCTVKILLFANSKFAKSSFHSKQNYLREFENNLELFYNDTKKLKPKNEDQKKTLNKKKNCN